jgi:adrenodoxin-NADP+ reductase
LQIEGLYTSGWVARGPNGVIATTMFDAFAAADLLASDLSSFPSTSERPPLPIEQLRGSARVVSWEDWEKIDQVEKERGKEKGKLREKITSVREMLEVLS